MKNLFLILDTETCTVPFVNEIAKTVEDKRKIATSRPLVYDIGWQIIDEQGKVYSEHSYLIQETFFVPNVFDTAYYVDKKKIYLDKLGKGEITVKNWNDVMDLLIKDLAKVNACGAFNAMFDFKKAIPFTEKYIKALYNGEVDKFLKGQRWYCETKILNKEKTTSKPTIKKTDDVKEFDNIHFELREKTYKMFDIWGIACKKLINIPKYKKACLKNGFLTASKEFFSTSAENVYQFLIKDYDFKESHTGLEDVKIEVAIFIKALKKGPIDFGIAYFPFRYLGTVVDFITERISKGKKVETELLDNLIEHFEIKATKAVGSYKSKMLNYAKKLINAKIEKMRGLAE